MRIEKAILKKSIIVFVVIEAIALILGVYEYVSISHFDSTVSRPDKGQGIEYKQYTVESDWGKEEIDVKVSPIKRDKEEIKELIENAKKEIDISILGENASLDAITGNLCLSNSYQNGVVNASWNFDNYEVIDSGGNLLFNNIEEDKVVRAYCILSVDDYEENYIFNFIIKKPSVKTKSGFYYLLSNELIKDDLNAKNTDKVTLPSKVENMTIKWQPKKSNSAMGIAVLGILAGGLIILASKNQAKNEEKALKKQLEADYPDIVSMISLYISAGVSIKGTVDKISNDYKLKLAKGESARPGFEGILKLQRQINDGRGELESIKEFGKRMNHKDYRKLSIILTQNLKKGTAMLAEQLEKEEQQAFEDRKLRAKIAGEEASTKLLLPMMGLLSIVLIVLIFPAIIGISV